MTRLIILSGCFFWHNIIWYHANYSMKKVAVARQLNYFLSMMNLPSWALLESASTSFYSYLSPIFYHQILSILLLLFSSAKPSWSSLSLQTRTDSYLDHRSPRVSLLHYAGSKFIQIIFPFSFCKIAQASWRIGASVNDGKPCNGVPRLHKEDHCPTRSPWCSLQLAVAYSLANISCLLHYILFDRRCQKAEVSCFQRRLAEEKFRREFENYAWTLLAYVLVLFSPNYHNMSSGIQTKAICAVQKVSTPIASVCTAVPCCWRRCLPRCLFVYHVCCRPQHAPTPKQVNLIWMRWDTGVASLVLSYRS